jgi:hypothetical protein
MRMPDYHIPFLISLFSSIKSNQKTMSSNLLKTFQWSHAFRCGAEGCEKRPLVDLPDFTDGSIPPEQIDYWRRQKSKVSTANQV